MKLSLLPEHETRYHESIRFLRTHPEAMDLAHALQLWCVGRHSGVPAPLYADLATKIAQDFDVRSALLNHLHRLEYKTRPKMEFFLSDSEFILGPHVLNSDLQLKFFAEPDDTFTLAAVTDVSGEDVQTSVFNFIRDWVSENPERVQAAFEDARAHDSGYAADEAADHRRDLEKEAGHDR